MLLNTDTKERKEEGKHKSGLLKQSKERASRVCCPCSPLYPFIKKEVSKMSTPRVPLVFYFDTGSSAEVTVPIEKYCDAMEYLSTWEFSSNQSREEMFQEFVKRFVW
jgi:hypothetical protein